VADRIDIQELAAALGSTRFGRPGLWHFHSSLPSTNTAAVKAAVHGADEGSVILADEQTAGRGRGEHVWHSPAGSGIYLSVVLRPQVAPADVLWLSIIAGLAAHRAIARTTTVATDLRWPNDIMLGEKKLGGILAEVSADTQRIRHAVVGIGINVNQPAFPQELREAATSLAIETGREWPRQEIIGALLESLDEEYRVLERDAQAPASAIERFAQASTYVRGTRVQVDDHGAGTYVGITAGLDERGFLRVQTGEGIRTVISGGVRKIVRKK
jgi:BirA family biotin operon repressor/biotin-[acetyl-CoA-carboxylase] ligase